MKRKISITIALVFGCFLFCLAAFADLTGKWTGVLKMANNDLPVTYNFKVEGDKLTGNAEAPQGVLPLMEGKISGTEFSFNLDFNGMPIKHTGKYYGDSIAIDVEFNGSKVHATLKRADK